MLLDGGTQMKKRSVDMTTGNPLRIIVMFALPILLGQIFQNLYNSVDSIVVGNFVGTTALAAVSSSADISRLLVGFFTGLSTGAGVLFAKYFGAGDYDDLHRSIHTALTFSLTLGLVMALTGVILTPFLLRIVDCPADVFPEAQMYLRIYFIGTLFTAIYNVASGVLRAVGDSRSPLYYLIITSLTNIVMDVLFVAIGGMGVEGVAFATIISQLLSCVLIFRNMLTTTDVYKLVPKDLKMEKEYLSAIVELGIPSAIQSSLTSISNLFVQRYINGFGSAAMAGTGAAKRIDRFIGLIALSFGQATTTYVSQNFGAGKTDRAFEAIRICLMLGYGSVLLLGTPVYLFAEQASRIFTNRPEAIVYSVAMIHTIMPLYFLQTTNQIFSNAVRGFGRSRAVMFLSLIGMIGCRQIYLAVSMAQNHVIENVYRGYPVGWGFSALFVIIYYFLVVKPGVLNGTIVAKKKRV